jgi:hypothetical protein
MIRENAFNAAAFCMNGALRITGNQGEGTVAELRLAKA